MGMKYVMACTGGALLNSPTSLQARADSPIFFFFWEKSTKDEAVNKEKVVRNSTSAICTVNSSYDDAVGLQYGPLIVGSLSAAYK